MNKDELVKKLELVYRCLIETHVSGRTSLDQFDSIIKELKQLENLTILEDTKHNWFEKLPLHWRYMYYMIEGIIIGLLLPHVW